MLLFQEFVDRRGHRRRVRIEQRISHRQGPLWNDSDMSIPEVAKKAEEHPDDVGFGRIPGPKYVSTPLNDVVSVDQWYQSRGLDPSTGRPAE